MKLFETEKTVLFKRASFLLFVISLIFLLLVQPPLYAQDDDDEFLISLPTRKKEGKASSMPAGTEAAALSGEMLQGVLYDLNRMDDGRLNKEFGGIPLTSEYLEERIAPTVRVLRPFVNGTWRREYDSQGKVHYPELDKYYRSATPIWRSHFYTSNITSDAVMDSFGCEDEVNPASWCCIYSGYVRAPFTGKFRFVGYGDDFLVIRFDQQVVLDYGYVSATLGEPVSDDLWKRVSENAKQVPRSAAQAKDAPLYPGLCPEFYFPDLCDDHGVATGKVLSVKEGDIIPIDILTSDLGGNFQCGVFIQMLDAKGKPKDENPKNLTLFRTRMDLPSQGNSTLPGFTPNGPIWLVADVTDKTNTAGKPADSNKTKGEEVKAKEKNGTASGTASAQAKKKAATIPIQYEDALSGVIYDLTQTADRKPTDLLKLQDIPNVTDNDYNILPVLKKFVFDSWKRREDGKGNTFFTSFNQYYRSPVNPRMPYFYLPIQSVGTVVRERFGEKDISERGWVMIQSGYVVAPFTGKFRFVGAADDALVIRFNRELVLDYGCFSLTWGKHFTDPQDYFRISAKKNQGRIISEKDLYSGKLETCFREQLGDRGAAKGIPVNVVKGHVYPIDILFSDIGGCNSFIAIFIEQLDSGGNPIRNTTWLPLFRTSSELPEHVSDTNNFPDFDPKSPIWKVVDAKGKPIPSRNPIVIEEGNEASDSFEEESSSRKMTETTQKKGGKVTPPFGSTQAAMEEDEEDWD